MTTPNPKPVQTPNDAQVKASIDQFDAQLQTVRGVTNAQDYMAMAISLVQLRRAQHYIKQRKDSVTKPLRAVEATVKEWFGSAEAKLAHSESKVRAMLEQYVDARVPEASAEAQAALAAGDTKAMVTAMGAVPAVPGISLATVVDFDVTDFDAVPDAFVKREINAAKVKAELRAGRSVPGIRGYERTQISVSIAAPGTNKDGV